SRQLAEQLPPQWVARQLQELGRGRAEHRMQRRHDRRVHQVRLIRQLQLMYVREVSEATRPSLLTILAEWGRIGCTGFGGPPAHLALLRTLCVDNRHWFNATEFEDAIAACNL